MKWNDTRGETKISEICYFLPALIVASVSPSIIRCQGIDNALYLSECGACIFLWHGLRFACLTNLANVGAYCRLLYGPEFTAAAPVLAFIYGPVSPVFLGVARVVIPGGEHLKNIILPDSHWGWHGNVVLNLVPDPRAWVRQGAAIATVIAYFVATYSPLKASRAPHDLSC